MKRFYLLILALFILLSACSRGGEKGQLSTVPDDKGASVAPLSYSFDNNDTQALTSSRGERYIVVLKDPSPTPAFVAKEIAGRTGSELLYTYSYAIKGFSAVVPTGRIREIQSDPRVLYVEKDQVYHLVDFDFGALGKGGGGGEQQAQTIPSGVLRIGANQNSNKGTDVGVAVIDTGISLSHPDLAANIAGNVNFVNTRKNGNDDNGHGSHVAGTIAAIDNTIGVVGVAPQAKLYAVKVLDVSGSGWISTIVKGIDWVTARASTIKAANMSFGGGHSTSLHIAVQNMVAAGVTAVVAAGNSYANSLNYDPASYSEVITVSALHDLEDGFAYFSNWGSPIDLIAPGVSIYSAYKGTGYATLSGTSMAAPHVTGSAALYIKTNPGSTPAAVQAGLIVAGEAGPGTGWPDDPDGPYNRPDPDGTIEPLVHATTL